jgi:hypothetical protein
MLKGVPVFLSGTPYFMLLAGGIGRNAGASFVAVRGT